MNSGDLEAATGRERGADTVCDPTLPAPGTSQNQKLHLLQDILPVGEMI